MFLQLQEKSSLARHAYRVVSFCLSLGV